MKAVRSFFNSTIALAACFLAMSVMTSSSLLAQASYYNPNNPADVKFLVNPFSRAAIGDREYYENITKVQNEQGASYQAPTMLSWDERGFAYVGVCQAIWYPDIPAADKKFVEDWPVLRTELQNQNLSIPTLGQGPCPWQSAEELNADLALLTQSDATLSNVQKTKKQQLSDFINFLNQKNVMTATFGSLSDRLEAAMDPDSASSMLKNLPPGQADLITQNFNKVVNICNIDSQTGFSDLSKPLGLYALVDYCSFKGEGTAPAERYNTEPWGLGEVLFQMNDLRSDTATLNAYIEKLDFKDNDPNFVDVNHLNDLELFVITAAKVLDDRIANNKIERDRIKGTPGYADFIKCYGPDDAPRTPEQEQAREQAFQQEFGIPYHDNSQYRTTLFYPHITDYLTWPSY